jgi:HAE1 family hydrophobic/amphiphilic exporter-1
MYFSGMTLNTVTLGGLALGVGRLVDDAIVVLENTFRHREAGKSKKEAALIGSQEVGTAIIASTLTTIVVFVPIAFMSGLTSVLFSQLAYTVAFALFCSLLIALSLIPVLCSKYLTVELPSAERHPWMHSFVERTGNALEALDLRYQKAVGWALHHRKTVVAGAAASVVATLLIVPYIGVELAPQTDESQVNINLEMASGTRLETSDAIALRMEEIVKKELGKDLDNLVVQVNAGGGGGGGFGGGGGAQLQVRLVDRDKRTRSTQEVAARLNEALNVEPGVRVRSNSAGGSMMPGMQNLGGGERASVEIRGFDIDQSDALAKRVQGEIQQIPGITTVRISRSAGMPEMLIRPDRIKAALFGLNVSTLGDVLETAVAGRQAGLYRENGKEYNIVVRLQEGDRSKLSDLDSIPISTPLGGTVGVGSLTSKRRQEGPVSIDRQDRERIITVSAGFFGRDLGSVMRDIETRVDPIRASLPVNSGFSIIYGGEYEQQQQSFHELLYALLLAVLLVYMIMAAQYESWRDPLIIMFSIPLAGVGVAVTLLVTQTNLSIQAFLGIIMLAGIAVSNAILLVDYTNILRRRDGLSVFDAVTKAGRTRLRPILMTTFATILGLLPMAFGFGEGGEVQAPMARVVIGGLITSTAITLLFVPTLYAIAEERSERRAARSEGKMLDEAISATQGDD